MSEPANLVLQDQNPYRNLSSGLVPVGAQTELNGLSGSPAAIWDLKNAPQTLQTNPDYQAPQRDYAAEARAAAIAAARTQFNDNTNVFRSSANTAGDNAARDYRYGIQDFVSGNNAAQQGIDTKGINALLGRNQSASGITAMVGQGIKSGGVKLGNRNAGSSSAVQGIADAYAKLGTQQMQDVNNQYGMAQNQIGLEQTNLNDTSARARQRLEEGKTVAVNNLLDSARQQIAGINANAANASLPERLAADQEVERIKNETFAKLQAHDAEFSNLKGAYSQDQVRSEATRLADLGTASTTPFQFTIDAPQGFQGQAPSGGSLPIFTYGRNRRTA